jgi:hypothetical protein
MVLGENKLGRPDNEEPPGEQAFALGKVRFEGVHCRHGRAH